jgi:hypothetical protein
MKCYKYFCMKLELFPQDVINLYNLSNKVDNKGNVHCAVCRGMYSLPQAGIIPQELLEHCLIKAGYTPKANSHQVIGNTHGDPSASHYWSTNLV